MFFRPRRRARARHRSPVVPYALHGPGSKKVRLSFYDGALVGRCGAHTARSATHPRTAPQADDMRIGQLFGSEDQHKQERHDELILTMC